jgi:hypothetical protein
LLDVIAEDELLGIDDPRYLGQNLISDRAVLSLQIQ